MAEKGRGKNRKNKNGLVPRQEAFCLEYVKHFNATKAAEDAGYKGKNVTSIACRMLEIPAVKERIDSLRADVAKAAGVDILTLFNKHKQIIECEITTIFTEEGLLKPLSEIPKESRTCIKSLTTEVVKNEKSGTVTTRHRVELYNKQISLEAMERIILINKGNIEVKESGMRNIQIVVSNTAVAANLERLK